MGLKTLFSPWYSNNKNILALPYKATIVSALIKVKAKFPK
jgi:hypothetical protein